MEFRCRSSADILAKGRICAQAIQVRVKHYYGKAGIRKPNLTVHSLRHTCATLCLTVGKADLLSVQRLLRHGNIQTTLRYLKSIDHLRDNAVDLNPVSLPGLGLRSFFVFRQYA